MNRGFEAAGAPPTVLPSSNSMPRFPMAAQPSTLNQNPWPELPLDAWQDTYATLHMWTQIAGKVRLALTPLINHWWEVPLYVNARGLTTSAIPYGDGIFEIQFDFIEHKLQIQNRWGPVRASPAEAQFVRGFHRPILSGFPTPGNEVKIWTMPCEVP